MAWCVGVSFYFQEDDTLAFLLSMLITFGCAFLFLLMGRKARNTLSRHDAFVVVTAVWVIFSFFGIVDLLATLPLYIGWFFGPVRYLMIVRTFRLIRVFRVFKLFSFLEEGDRLMRSLMLSSRKIMVFFLFVVIMVISLGTLMFMIEGSQPNTQFHDIPSSIYWAVVTMTTVGYGDIAPVTHLGRMLSMLVMLLGYTIMAVPTGIVSAQFVHDRHIFDAIGPKCPECGSPITDDMNYCPHCGLPLQPHNTAVS